MVLVVLGAGVFACKPRSEQSVLRANAGEEDTAVAVSAEAAAQVQAVRATCEGQNGSLFRGNGPGSVAYVPERSIDNGARASGELVQPEWFEEAIFRGTATNGAWHLSSAVRDNTVASFLRGRRVLTTREFTAALGCTNLKITDVEPGACAGKSGCSVVLAQASFDLPGGEGIPPDGVLALTDAGLSCPVADGRSQLTGTGGAAIGMPVDGEQDCRQLQESAAHGLVCAWTGWSFGLFRTDGRQVGGAGGSTTLAACARQITTFNDGLVCVLDGDGFIPFYLSEKSASFRVGSGGTTLDACRGRVSALHQKRICSADRDGLRIYDVDSGQPRAEFGAFGDETDCLTVLAALGDSKVAAMVTANVREAAGLKLQAQPVAGSAGDDSGIQGLGLTDIGYTYKQCHDPARGYHIVATDSSGDLICKMDTLYSWGPRSKIDWLKEQSWSGRLRRDGKIQPVFTTQSPYATFGYGDYAIRFKLRDKVRYWFIKEGALKNPYEYCNQLSLSQLDDTVIVRWWNNNLNYTGLDFILCSLGPVHSWSWGTQEHFNELKADIAWIGANNYKDYELYVKRNGVDVNYPDNLDGNKFSYLKLSENLERHAQSIGNNIFYNPAADKKSAFWHFKTSWPIYFNPK